MPLSRPSRAHLLAHPLAPLSPHPLLLCSNVRHDLIRLGAHDEALGDGAVREGVLEVERVHAASVRDDRDVVRRGEGDDPTGLGDPPTPGDVGL